MRNAAIFRAALVLLCGYSFKNRVDQVNLSPGQSKTYSFETNVPLSIGVLLDHEVTGGLVQLKQAGSASSTGTRVHWIAETLSSPAARRLVTRAIALNKKLGDTQLAAPRP